MARYLSALRYAWRPPSHSPPFYGLVACAAVRTIRRLFGHLMPSWLVDAVLTTRRLNYFNAGLEKSRLKLSLFQPVVITGLNRFKPASINKSQFELIKVHCHQMIRFFQNM